MTRIEASKDCGNSPKNQLLQELTIAVARANRTKIVSILTSDVSWVSVGNKPVEGADAVAKALTRYGPATKLVIEQVVSHGKAGAVNGVVTFGEKQRGFCHVFEFNSAKGTQVSGIKSYSAAIER